MRKLKKLLPHLVLVLFLGIQPPLINAAAQEGKWETAGSRESGFLIDFPGQPKSFSKEGPTGKREFRYDLEWGSPSDGLFFRATSTPFAEGKTQASLTEMLVDSEDFIKGMARSLETEVQKTWAYKLGTFPARSGRLIGQKKSAQVVAIVGETQYFILLVLTEKAALLDRPEVGRFLNSFDFYETGVKRREQGFGGVSGPSRPADTAFPPTAEWLEFETDDRAFSLKFPGKPELSEEENTALGKIRKARVREIRDGKVTSYALNYNPVTKGAAEKVRESTVIQDNLSKTFAERTGGEVLSSQVVTVEGFPARRIVVYHKEKRILTMTLLVITDTHYLNLAASSGLDKEEIEPRLDFFLKSLKIRPVER